jgi:hypothetical protein
MKKFKSVELSTPPKIGKLVDLESCLDIMEPPRMGQNRSKAHMK